ncbi:MAG: hypothetical protein ABS82_02755 [Rhodanobacter sp. SCN 67-45]|nr:MAG: hypothetical protein ABS82_02755 [Rhodanobacter sp. SCN 67-45]
MTMYESPSTRTCSPTADDVLTLWLRALLNDGGCEFAELMHVLRRALDDPADPVPRGLGLFLRHLLFLFESGKELFADCTLRRDDQSHPILVARRIAHEDGGAVKTQAYLRPGPIRDEATFSAAGAFAVYSHGPGIVIRRGPVRIEAATQEIGVPLRIAPLREDEIGTFYANRRTLHEGMRAAYRDAGDALHARLRTAIEDDRRHVMDTCLEAFECSTEAGEVLNGRPLDGIGRSSHPYRGATLHVLPRLVRPTRGRSVLAVVADELERVAAAGFEALLLGVVDRQSADLYYDESDNGSLLPYLNNHGYWSSGETGVDPVLGSDADYAKLRAHATAHGVYLVQDSVYGTLGYPPQLARLAPVASRCTPFALAPADRSAALCDAGVFLGRLENGDDIPSTQSLPLPEYVEAVTRMHLGEYYQLPRPNLFDPSVHERVLARVRWQIQQAGVSAFRIDMAKHLGLVPLRRTLDALREGVRCSGMADFFAVLEYWSLQYRDLRFALSAVGPADHTYLYDFPLAHALQCVLLREQDWSQILPALVAERVRWAVDPCCLVPVFVDHDPSFRPIYNGSARTRDIVVAGLTLALAMSANGPSVYCGYDDRHAAPRELECYFDYSEQRARVAIAHLVADDPDAPGGPFAQLLAVVRRLSVLSGWDGGVLKFEGDARCLCISRTVADAVGQRRIRFCVARDGTAATAVRAGEAVVYASGQGPSVAVFVS